MTGGLGGALVKPESIEYSSDSVLCRHKATEMEKELEMFTNQYLQPQL